MKKADIVPIGLAKPNEDVINELKTMMAMAEKGELRSLVWCGSGVTDIFSGFTTGANIWEIIGHLERIKHRLLCNADERAEHVD